MTDPLVLAAWQLVLGELPSEALPRLATDALTRGVDSPALRELAGQSAEDVRASQDLFRTVIVELGLPTLNQAEAARALARGVAEDIIAGKLSPAAGAQSIWRSAYRRVEEEGDLRIFVGLASELEDHPEDQTAIEAEIVAAARELLAREAPRRWVQLMARKGSGPLTRWSSDLPTSVDARSLPINPDLLIDIEQWAFDFDETYSEVPEESGFASESEAEAFVARGRNLAERLQSDLGPGWHIEYRPEPIRPPGVRIKKS
jgi:hypothetical protein